MGEVDDVAEAEEADDEYEGEEGEIETEKVDGAAAVLGHDGGGEGADEGHCVCE